MELVKGALDAWITREPSEYDETDDRADLFRELMVPDPFPCCDWIGCHAPECEHGCMADQVDAAVEALLDSATRLMGFARSAQNDAMLSPVRALEVLADLKAKVDCATQLARLDTAL